MVKTPISTARSLVFDVFFLWNCSEFCLSVMILVVDFFNRINVIYGVVCEFCNEQTCPTMSGGPKWVIAFLFFFCIKVCGNRENFSRSILNWCVKFGNKAGVACKMLIMWHYCEHTTNWVTFQSFITVMRFLSVRLSVCLSVTRVDCDKMEERLVQIFTPHERTFSLVFWEEEWLVAGDPFYVKFWVNRPPLEWNRRFLTNNRS